MNLSDAQILQMSITLVMALVVFVIAYSLKPKVSATLLLLLIPFQPINTKYASANVVLAFVLFIAYLRKGVQIRLPVLPQMLVVLFALLLNDWEMSFVLFRRCSVSLTKS